MFRVYLAIYINIQIEVNRAVALQHGLNGFI